MRFTPVEAIRDQVLKAGQGQVTAAGGLMVDVPVVISVSGQIMEVGFQLQAHVVTSKLVLSAKRFDFGNCFLNQSMALPVTIFNPSPYLQKFFFVHLPPEIQILETSWGSILPGRSVVRNVVFKPQSAIALQKSLLLKTEIADEYHLPVTGLGIDPPVKFQNLIIEYPAVSNLDTHVVSNMVTNVSKVPKTLVFHVLEGPLQADEQKEKYYPLNSFITVIPQVAVLNPGQSLPIEFEMKPVIETDRGSQGKRAEDEAEDEDSSKREANADARDTKSTKEKKEKEKKKTHKKKSAQELAEEAEQARKEEEARKEEQARLEREAALEHLDDEMRQIVQAERLKAREVPPNPLLKHSVVEYSNLLGDPNFEPWSRHSRHRVVCFVRDATAAAAVAALAPSPVEDAEVLSALYLELRTTVVLPALSCTPDHLDFGQMAVAKSATKQIVLKNHSEATVDLEMVLKGISSPFLVLNALRSLGPGEHINLVVEFKPVSVKKYSDYLTLRAKGSNGITVVTIFVLFCSYYDIIVIAVFIIFLLAYALTPLEIVWSLRVSDHGNFSRG